MEKRFEQPRAESADPYVAPETAAELRPEAPHWSLWLIYLVFRPEQFFRTFVIDSAPALTVITAWLFGIVGVMDQIESRGITDPDNPLLALKAGWGLYWGTTAALGALSGALYYVIGGWWYRVRLDWSAAKDPDKALARRVYVYSAQAYVVPFLLYTAWETYTYATPLAASAADDWGALLIVVALLWSVYVSYRGVRTAFEVRAWPARIWFLVLPGLLYGGMLVGFFIAGLVSAWVFEPAPEVDRPTRIERETFALEYPGNWVLDVEDEDYDPDTNFGIGPAFADATIRVWFYENRMDSRECVDATRDNLAAAYELGPLREIERWGDYRGAGYKGNCTIEGKAFAVVMFCRTDESPSFEVLQIVEKPALRRTRPGFELIRDSLRVPPD